MYRTIQLKKVLTIVGVTMVGLLMVTSVQAEIIDNFETGYTNGATINGINGWVNLYGTGLRAGDGVGKDGSWGAYSGATWDGSQQVHGLDLSAGSRIVFDVDVMQDSEGDGHRVKILDPTNSKRYINASLNIRDSNWNLAYRLGGTSSEVIADSTTGLSLSYDTWYHINVDWTIDGALYATLSDASGTVIDTLGSDTLGASVSSINTYLTRAGIYGGYDTVFDNVMVQIPEPSTLAMLASSLIGLLCYAWRKRK